MSRFRYFVRLIIMVAVAAGAISLRPAQANVDALVLFSRTCGTVSAFARYDSFSEGTSPFYAAFAVDLNGNGIFGEANERIRYVKVTPGQESVVGARLTFKPLPEGSTIAVTAYEVDSDGVIVSAQLPPVKYVCAHRPATNPLPPNTGITIPGLAVTAQITASALLVYSQPNAFSDTLGGLANGMRVPVMARNERGDWAEIEYRGQLGWIMWQTNAILWGPFSNLPVLPNVEPTPGS